MQICAPDKGDYLIIDGKTYKIQGCNSIYIVGGFVKFILEILSSDYKYLSNMATGGNAFQKIYKADLYYFFNVEKSQDNTGLPNAKDFSISVPINLGHSTEYYEVVIGSKVWKVLDCNLSFKAKCIEVSCPLSCLPAVDKTFFPISLAKQQVPEELEELYLPDLSKVKKSKIECLEIE